MTAPQTSSGLVTVRVDCVDPLVLACAACGWIPAGCWPSDLTSRLLWAVIDHWQDTHRQEANG